MKAFVFAAALAAMPCAAYAGPYVAGGVFFDSVSFNTPANGVVPADLSGYQAEVGYTFRRLGLGAEYSAASSAKSGNDLATNRFAANLAWYVPVIPGIDTFLQGGIGRSTYHADVSSFANGATTTSRLFTGSETDWHIGAGAVVPIYGPLKARLIARYQPTEFGGRANSGIVFGASLMLAR